jgi:glycosyltransferase involved in cell wall biosynthesis
MPEFSVIIPCRDAAATVPSALASLRAQTCQDWEAICIDDGSCDDTAQVIDRVARLDDRVRRVTIAPGGPGLARNVGALTHAGGRLIAFLDADDLWRPDKLETVAAVFAARVAPDAVFAQTLTFSDDPAFRPLPARKRGADRPLDALAVLTDNPVATMSNMTVRRDVFQHTGGFDVRLSRGEDVEWLIRLIASGAVIRKIDQTLTLRRAPGAPGAREIMAQRRGWLEAVETARILDVAPSRENLARAEAIQLRRLAARALGIETPGTLALRYAALGLVRSPAAFLSDFPSALHTLVLIAALPLTPRGLRKTRLVR